MCDAPYICNTEIPDLNVGHGIGYDNKLIAVLFIISRQKPKITTK
jgi:hypothetical protein